MEYEDLYDESPYASPKEVTRRGGTMSIIRATFLVCATIIASVFAMLFYGYQQDQYVVNSSGDIVSIFDKRSRILNLCDRMTCRVLVPILEHMAPPVAGGISPTAVMPPQNMGVPGGPRLLGSFPQQPPMMPPGVNPGMMRPPMMGPQGPMGGPMGPQMGPMGPMMGPQGPMGSMGPMGGPMANPAMMGPQMRPPMMGNPAMMNPQMINGGPQGMRPQMMGGGPQPNGPGPNAGGANADNAPADNADTGGDDNADTGAGDNKAAAAGGDTAAEGDEEAAPV